MTVATRVCAIGMRTLPGTSPDDTPA
jgi:hypothetical protein